MVKNVLFSVIVLGSLTLVGAPKLTHEEKVARRVQKILESKEDHINRIKENIDELQELLQKLALFTEKEGVSEELLQKINDFLFVIITRLKTEQDRYFESLTAVFKNVQVKSIAKKEFEEVKEFYSKHLELFSDEVVALIKILLPFKDIDTMTEEEIAQALVF